MNRIMVLNNLTVSNEPLGRVLLKISVSIPIRNGFYLNDMKNLIGQKFGKLLIIEQSITKDKRRIYWKCICDCGKTADTVRQDNLLYGNSNSCGCNRPKPPKSPGRKRKLTSFISKNKNIKTVNKKSKKIFKYFSKTATYTTWRGMIQRCNNINNTNYKDYGGRGIKVCDKWLKFEGFYEDMGDRPDNLTLDRINVNGNYCKENCRWSSWIEQGNNKRNQNIKEVYDFNIISPINYMLYSFN